MNECVAFYNILSKQCEATWVFEHALERHWEGRDMFYFHEHGCILMKQEGGLYEYNLSTKTSRKFMDLDEAMKKFCREIIMTKDGKYIVYNTTDELRIIRVSDGKIINTFSREKIGISICN